MITSKSSGLSKIIYKSNNLAELLRHVEELAHIYICGFQVQPETYKKKSISGKWGKVEYGYFMVHKCDKVIIYKKYISLGYIYNSDKIEKIISFSIIRPSARVFEPIKFDIDDVAESIDIKTRLWADIHTSIRKKSDITEINPGEVDKEK